MRWEDERYVRFYTRDTPEFLALSWVARALFGLILRKVDRAGILSVGKLGLKGVAVAIGGPWVEVEAPLAELLADGCLVFDEARVAVLVPNFILAQDAPQSDAARKRASREKARAEIGGSAFTSEIARQVTNRDSMSSQNVTKSHTESRPVTSGHVESLRAVPSRTDPEIPPKPPQGGEPAKGGKRRRTQTPAHPMPPDWKPDTTVVALAKELGFERPAFLAELGKFRDHAAAHARRCADWQGAARGWFRKAIELRPELVRGPVGPTGGATPTTYTAAELRENFAASSAPRRPVARAGAAVSEEPPPSSGDALPRIDVAGLFRGVRV